MSNIYDFLKKIKTAVYGIDVRDAIHDAIKQTYRDAIDAGNSSMEVSDARGTYSTLGERLNSLNGNNLTLKEITDTVVSINLENDNFYECKNKITNLSINSADNIRVNFKSFISFTTDNIENTKATQTNVFLTGDHCTGGKIELVKNTSYFIELSYLKSNCIIGQVFCFVEGDSGNEDIGGEEDPTPIVTEFHDFYGADELIEVAMSYYRQREKYTTYGNTNILTNEGSYKWASVTMSGADSPDNRYRYLDCSAFAGLCMRGIAFNEVFANESAYNTKDLSPRTSIFDWAYKLSRTAADMCKDAEDLGWGLSEDKWHTEGTKDFSGLKKGDLIFFKGTTDNHRHKMINHVSIFYGKNSKNKNCVIECTSSSGVKKHSDGVTCGIQIVQFSKKATDRIVSVIRPQGGTPK